MTKNVTTADQLDDPRFMSPDDRIARAGGYVIGMYEQIKSLVLARGAAG
jgi:hypothetical protein